MGEVMRTEMVLEPTDHVYVGTKEVDELPYIGDVVVETEWPLGEWHHACIDPVNALGYRRRLLYGFSMGGVVRMLRPELLRR